MSSALKLYDALYMRYPASKWADDARQAAQDIQRPSVGLYSPGPQPVRTKRPQYR